MEEPRKWKIKKSLIFAFLGLIVVVYIAFIEQRGKNRQFSELEVYVEGISQVYFVEEKEIHQMLQHEFPELQPGEALRKISLYDLEKKVESHPFVHDADVFGDLKGVIMVKISQHIPMARIVRPMAADGYISTEGKILPLSSNFTPRVITVAGRGADKILEKGELGPEHEGFLKLLTFVTESDFWSAQINAMDLLSNGEILLHQQVGKQVIEFGKPEDIERKFQKINLYYNDIVPKKGWNAYNRVNVKFKDQIICE